MHKNEYGNDKHDITDETFYKNLETRLMEDSEALDNMLSHKITDENREKYFEEALDFFSKPVTLDVIEELKKMVKMGEIVW